MNWSQVGCTPCRLNKAKDISKQLKLNPQPFYTTACFLMALYIEVTCKKVSFHTNLSSLSYFNARKPRDWGFYSPCFHTDNNNHRLAFFFFQTANIPCMPFLSCWNTQTETFPRWTMPLHTADHRCPCVESQSVKQTKRQEARLRLKE